MAKTVKITSKNTVSVIDIPWTYDSQKKAIHADCFEVVKTQIMYDLFGDTVVMLVDESGLIKNRLMNHVASTLYGYELHGSPICGDVILGLQRGPDVLPPDSAEDLMRVLLSKYSCLREEKEKEQVRTLTYKGMDSWSRPVYEDENGTLWKDVDPRAHVPASLHSSVNNAFDGEPDKPIHGRFKFVPKRITW